MLSPEKIADLRLKQLEMLQAIINRMVANSASSKNYCLTLTTAMVGFALSLKLRWVMLAAFLPVFVFLFLDAQYLRLERQYRNLYNQVRKQDWEIMPDFDFSPNDADSIKLLHVVASWSVGSFYACLVVGLLVIIVFDVVHGGN